MKMVALIRILKIGVVDFWRNRWLSLAAIMMMTLTISIISLFVALDLSINQTAKMLEDKIDISVFFNDNATDANITALQNSLLGRSDVKSITYISREQALARFREQSQYRSTVLKLLDQGYGSKLPRSIEIKANGPENLQSIADYVNQSQYKTSIDKVSYQENKQLIDKYIKSAQFVKEVGLVLSAIFILIAILVIYNTIRLTIFMRREEVEIMQLVGATGWYIKFPFVLEGILYGAFATVITTILLIIGAKSASPYITNYVGSASFNFGQFFTAHLWLIILVEIFVGVVIGGLCSYFAVRTHVK
ncbi:MAG: permease-like cell division protein FtsX [Patescibacteria group bacterium]|jgi:cell division transport system permease protein